MKVREGSHTNDCGQYEVLIIRSAIHTCTLVSTVLESVITKCLFYYLHWGYGIRIRIGLCALDMRQKFNSTERKETMCYILKKELSCDVHWGDSQDLLVGGPWFQGWRSCIDELVERGDVWTVGVSCGRVTAMWFELSVDTMGHVGTLTKT